MNPKSVEARQWKPKGCALSRTECPRSSLLYSQRAGVDKACSNAGENGCFSAHQWLNQQRCRIPEIGRCFSIDALFNVKFKVPNRQSDACRVI